MNVLWIKDPITGHQNKVRGVLRTLSSKRKLDIIEHDLEWRWSPVRQLLPFMGMPAFAIPLKCLLKRPPELGQIDLVISAGGATQWPNAAVSHRIGCPNVFLGSLRRMNSSHFNLIASHEVPLNQPRFHQYDLIPSMITPDGARTAAESAGVAQQRAWGLLLGGNGEGLRWALEDYLSLVNRFILQAKSAGHGIRIATSRRTPIMVERTIKGLAEESGILLGDSWFHEPGERSTPLIATMGACSMLCVTADSMSMTHEAVSSGRPVISVMPEQTAFPRLTSNLEGLENKGYLTVQTVSELSVAEGAPDCGWNLVSGDPSEPIADGVLAALDREYEIIRNPNTATRS
jgi:mitochondrial fission protein ELM1